MQALIRVHRLEYPFSLHYLCYAAWGACYAAQFELPVLLAIAANFTAIVAGNPLNAAADIRNDMGTTEKRYVAEAVLLLGRERVLALAGVEMTVALAMAATVSWLATAGTGLIILLYLAYNLEPVRLKRRGYAGPIALGLTVGFLPCVVSYSATGVDFDPSVWSVFAGLGVLATGRALWWSVPDRDGDAAAATATPVVRFGKRRALAASSRITLAGLVLLGCGLWIRHGPPWAVLGVAVSATFLLARTLPDSRLMRRYGMTLVVCANLVVAAIPLLA